MAHFGKNRIRDSVEAIRRCDVRYMPFTVRLHRDSDNSTFE